jgi:hypothetical protein
LQGGKTSLQTLATVYELCGFLTVTHAEDLVGGAQVLLYRRLGEEEVLGDLCVAESLGDELQYLPLADGERVEIRGVIVRYEALEELPGATISPSYATSTARAI